MTPTPVQQFIFDAIRKAVEEKLSAKRQQILTDTRGLAIIIKLKPDGTVRACNVNIEYGE